MLPTTNACMKTKVIQITLDPMCYSYNNLNLMFMPWLRFEQTIFFSIHNAGLYNKWLVHSIKILDSTIKKAITRNESYLDY